MRAKIVVFFTSGPISELLHRCALRISPGRADAIMSRPSRAAAPHSPGGLVVSQPCAPVLVTEPGRLA